MTKIIKRPFATKKVPSIKFKHPTPPDRPAPISEGPFKVEDVVDACTRFGWVVDTIARKVEGQGTYYLRHTEGPFGEKQLHLHTPEVLRNKTLAPVQCKKETVSSPTIFKPNDLVVSTRTTKRVYVVRSTWADGDVNVVYPATGLTLHFKRGTYRHWYDPKTKSGEHTYKEGDTVVVLDTLDITRIKKIKGAWYLLEGRNAPAAKKDLRYPSRFEVRAFGKAEVKVQSPTPLKTLAPEIPKAPECVGCKQLHTPSCTSCVRKNIELVKQKFEDHFTLEPKKPSLPLGEVMGKYNRLSPAEQINTLEKSLTLSLAGTYPNYTKTMMQAVGMGYELNMQTGLWVKEREQVED